MRRNSGFMTFLQSAFTGNMIITTKCCKIHKSTFQWSTIFLKGGYWSKLHGIEEIFTTQRPFLLSFRARKCKLTIRQFHESWTWERKRHKSSGSTRWFPFNGYFFSLFHSLFTFDRNSLIQENQKYFLFSFLWRKKKHFFFVFSRVFEVSLTLKSSIAVWSLPSLSSHIPLIYSWTPL